MVELPQVLVYSGDMDKSVVSWFKNDKLFQQELIKGILWQLYVAEKFRQLGCDVERMDLSLKAGPVEEREKFINSKDLIVNGHVIEVKSRNQAFNGADDFPYDTLFVDTKDGFDRKVDKPSFYVCVSQLTGGMCALNVDESFKHWKTTKTWDTVRKISLTAYECHRDVWVTVEEAAKVLCST